MNIGNKEGVFIEVVIYSNGVVGRRCKPIISIFGVAFCLNDKLKGIINPQFITIFHAGRWQVP